MLERNEFWEVLTKCIGHLPEPMCNVFVIRDMDVLEAAIEQ